MVQLYKKGIFLHRNFHFINNNLFFITGRYSLHKEKNIYEKKEDDKIIVNLNEQFFDRHILTISQDNPLIALDSKTSEKLFQDTGEKSVTLDDFINNAQPDLFVVLLIADFIPKEEIKIPAIDLEITQKDQIKTISIDGPHFIDFVNKTIILNLENFDESC